MSDRSRSWQIAAIGLTSWDSLQLLDRALVPGTYAIVRETISQSGGTTSNIAAALSRLGINVTLAAYAGDDDLGKQLREELDRLGVDTRYLWTREHQATDRATILVSGQGPTAERTILWHQGARLQHGDWLPIEELFAADLVILDVDDLKLRRLIVDLPMHVSPRTRLLGPLTYLTEAEPELALDLAGRHDYATGNEAEWLAITGEPTIGQVIQRVQRLMPLNQLRLAAITLGARGCIIFNQASVVEVPAFDCRAVDTTGAGDAFAAGLSIGILERWALAEIGYFANAVAGLSTRAAGARAGLPSRPEADALMAEQLSAERTGS
ncbi:MAG TPA: carbohydrate kinase family protein [Thermomicrobiaceae bacterium]|nr:carbohydrate kinase family protein [Thermomicrobiaceae bacterium]